jgi:RNA-binding protein
MDDLALTGAQRAYLRGLGQRLGDSLTLGREGITPGVKVELERLLKANELVKLRFANADRHERAALGEAIEKACSCTCVGAVGHTALFYRQNPEAAERRIEFPAC